jgi:hypothetical protein
VVHPAKSEGVGSLDAGVFLSSQEPTGERFKTISKGSVC